MKRRDVLWAGGAVGLQSVFHSGLAWAEAGPLALGSLVDRSPSDATGVYGVASGDPSADGFVIWTRVPDSVVALLSGSPEISVSWWVSQASSSDPASRPQRLLGGTVLTDASRDHTVKVLCDGLAPGTGYHYGFAIDDLWQSEIGHARTLPGPHDGLERVTCAYVSCQKFGMGYYTVYAALAADADVDFCVHLGDSVYESVSSLERFVTIRPDPVGEAFTKEEYWSLYRRALSDPAYREVRRRFTWIQIPDDHEVYNDYAGTDPTDRKRRAYALEAYADYTAVRELGASAAERFSIPRVYRMGNLASLIALDERRYRDGVPCEKVGSTLGCTGKLDPQRSMLGVPQRIWLKSQLQTSETRWNVLLSQLMVMPLEMIKRPPSLGTHPLESLLHHSPIRPREGQRESGEVHALGLVNNVDAWDGFPAEREELLSVLAEKTESNCLIWTGDIHNLYAGHLKSGDKPVAYEMTTGSVTSPGIGDVFRLGTSRLVESWVRTRNPHMNAVDLRHHMYIKCTLTPDAARFRAISVNTIRSWHLVSGCTLDAVVRRGDLQTQVRM